MGQANFTGNTAATTQSGLRRPAGLFYESSTNRLFVADQSNNRVMVFDVAAITNGENASNVLGQTNFTTGTSGVTQTTFNNPTDVSLAVFSGQSLLFVPDEINNRVMIFNVNSITDGEEAFRVLGQSDFTSNGTGTTSTTLNLSLSNASGGVLADATNNRIFVSDGNNNRILIFSTSDGLTNGEAAVNVLGQANFTSSSSATTQGHLDLSSAANPAGFYLDAVNSRLYAADPGNNRVMIFNLSDGIADGENAVNALGQLDTDGNPVYTQSSADNATLVTANSRGFNSPLSVALDSTNRRLFVVDGSNNRVLVFNLDANLQPVDRVADAVLGQANFTSVATATTQSGLNTPNGLAYDATGNRLFVADTVNNRVLVFDVASITNGENAASVLGQVNFTSSTAATTQSGFSSPSGLNYDSINQRLFVSDTVNLRVLVFDVAAIVNGENAVNVLGQSDFTSATPTLSQTSLTRPAGLAFNSTTNLLFVADQTGHRVMVFDVAAITNGEAAANVLGQTSFTTIDDDTTQSNFNTPGNLALDQNNNQLYVSDSSNHRVMVFDTATLTNGEPAVNVLGQTSFTAGSSGISQSAFNGPQGLAWDSTNHRLWAVDQNNHRVMMFNAVRITTATLPAGVRGTAYSQTVASTGSQGTVTFAVSSGSLPTGLSLNATSGVISGTPSVGGGTSSTFTIRASDTGDAGAFVDDQSYTVTITGGGGGSTVDTVPPSPPLSIRISSAEGKVTLTWTDPKDADLKHIEILRSSGGDTSVAGEPITYVPVGAQKYTDAAVTVGETYKYILRSRDNSNNFANSEEQSITVLAGAAPVTPVADAPSGETPIAPVTPTTPAFAVDFAVVQDEAKTVFNKIVAPELVGGLPELTAIIAENKRPPVVDPTRLKNANAAFKAQFGQDPQTIKEQSVVYALMYKDIIADLKILEDKKFALDAKIDPTLEREYDQFLSNKQATQDEISRATLGERVKSLLRKLFTKELAETEPRFKSVIDLRSQIASLNLQISDLQSQINYTSSIADNATDYSKWQEFVKGMTTKKLAPKITAKKCPVFVRSLRLGSIHEEVKTVQQFLIDQGFLADSDNDGLFDEEEIMTYQTDPLNPDTDGDTYQDGQEIRNGYNPKGEGKLFTVPQSFQISNNFDRITDRAVRAFQAQYIDEILIPWGKTAPTGFWHITTKRKANALLGCK